MHVAAHRLRDEGESDRSPSWHYSKSRGVELAKRAETVKEVQGATSVAFPSSEIAKKNPYIHLGFSPFPKSIIWGDVRKSASLIAPATCLARLHDE